MRKRKYPLFIVDASHQHGREKECDYISCTSKENPFIAIKDFISNEQYIDEYDPKDQRSAYSENVRGVRMRVRIIDIDEQASPVETRNLLKRLLKELIARQQVQKVDLSNITPENIVTAISRLREQTYEALRDNPEDLTQKMMRNIFTKIIEDYS